MSGKVRRICVAMVVLVTAVLASSSSPPVSAASEIRSFVATPGYLRTDYVASRVISHPVDDVLYGVRGSGDRWTIDRIDANRMEITADVPLAAARVVDLVVSDDGDWLFVLTPDGVHRYDSTTMDLKATFDISLNRRSNELDVAPDRLDRFAIVSGSGVRIFTAGTEVDVDGTPLEFITGFGFTNNSDIAVVKSNEGLVTVDITNGATVVTTAPAPIAVRGIIDRLGDDFVFWSSQEVTRVGPDLVAQSRTDFEGFSQNSRPARRLVDGVFYSRSVVSGLRFDFVGDAAPVEWNLPTTELIPSLQAAISDERIVGLEGAGRVGEPGHLVIMNSRVLTSGFGDFHPVTPERILDTRKAIGIATTSRMGPGRTIVVDVAGLAGLPDDGVLAVTLNVSATEPTGNGYLKVWPTDVERPGVSNLNYVRSRTIANSATVSVGADGKLQLYNHVESATHVLIDVTGYYTDATGDPGARYVPRDRGTRLMDTRAVEFGRNRTLGQGEFMDIPVPFADTIGTRDRRKDAVAAVLNVTVVDATAFSFVAAYPPAAVRPETSNINFYPGDIRSNLVITQLSAEGTVRIYNHVGEVNVVVDLFGHYALPFDGPGESVDQWGRLYPVSPFRDFDSREDSPFGGDGSLTPGGVLTSPNSTGWTDILNLTVTEPTSAGYISVIGWLREAGLPRFETPFPPPISNVNFTRDETVSNAAYATGMPDHAIVNVLGKTHIVIDVFGYLTPMQLRSSEAEWNQS